MTTADSSSSNSMSDTARLQGIIMMLSLLIKIGRILPWIVLAFAGVNMVLALLYFTVWDSMIGGIINAILAFAGFLFFGQLVRRRKIRRQSFRYKRIDTPAEPEMTQGRRRVDAEAR